MPTRHASWPIALAVVVAAAVACGEGEQPVLGLPDAGEPVQPPPPVQPESPPWPQYTTPALCWTPTGATRAYRISAGAALMKDGRVLIVGGEGEGTDAQASAEVYDPASGTWTDVPPMQERRLFPAVVPLQDGRVLVAGGYSRVGEFYPTYEYPLTAEIFDPAKGEWSLAAPMLQTHPFAWGLRLGDGRVLMAYGGLTDKTSILELYDPVRDTWTELPGYKTEGRVGAAPAVASDGRAFFEGSLDSAYYDAAHDTWNTVAPKAGTYASRLQAFDDGRILSPRSFEGGAGELYSPATNTWTRTGAYLEPRHYEQFAFLQDGRLLMTGGMNPSDEKGIATSEVYDLNTGAWTSAGRMGMPRRNHVLVTLQDGRVLVAGGFSEYAWLRIAELYDPGCKAEQ